MQMFIDKTVLAIIPARGGSKGLPGKNIRPLCGKPLLAWTIEAALQSVCITDCIVSSDDAEILEISRQWGAQTPFVRPKRLAADNSRTSDVVFHAMQNLIKRGQSYRYVIVLQPTSPLRVTEDIDNAFKLLLQREAPCCVSVCETDHPPFWMYALSAEEKLIPLLPTEVLRRQDLPVSYRLNGAIYIAQIDWLKHNKSFLTDETIAYVMPKERSVDIDDIIDFQIADFLLSRQQRKPSQNC